MKKIKKKQGSFSQIGCEVGSKVVRFRDHVIRRAAVTRYPVICLRERERERELSICSRTIATLV